jgi:hypothetical protein
LTTERVLKLGLCFCFGAIALSLALVGRHSPATGYELSIYDSLPAAVWILLFTSMLGGIVIVVHQAFVGRTSRYWALGFLVLMLCMSLVYLLPALRDYYLYASSDTMAHVRWTDEILSTSHFGIENRYPITHVLMTQVAQIAGVPPEAVAKYVPPLFSVMFALSCYLLAQAVLPTKRSVLLSAAAGTVAVFSYYHVAVYPQALSVMLLPLIFYVYFKDIAATSASFRIALIVLLLLYTFFHPAPAIVLIACLLTAEFTKVLWRLREGKYRVPGENRSEQFNYRPALILTIAFFTWISSFYIFEATIVRIWLWLGGEIRSIPRVEEIETLLASQGLGPLDQAVLGLKMYGDNLAYVALSVAGLTIVALGFVRGRDSIRKLAILSTPFLVSGPVWILTFAGSLQVTLGRLLGSNIMMWATPVFVAFALSELLGRWRKAGLLVASAVVAMASIVGVLGVYHSPFIAQPSWQVTQRDLRGTEWFRNHTGLQSKGIFATLGVPPALAWGAVLIPEHFGYESNGTVGQSLPTDTLLVKGSRFDLSCTHPILSDTLVADPRLARPGFDAGDLRQLERDATVSKVYSNGELEVLLVEGELE